MRQYIAPLLLSLTAFAAHAQDVKEGQWEYQTVVKTGAAPQLSAEQRAQIEAAKAQMEAMKSQMPPGFKMPGMDFDAAGGVTSTFKQCVTKENWLPPQGQEPGMKCETTQQQRKGNRIEFVSRCTGEGADITSEGWAEYTGARMTSEVQARGKAQGRSMEMSVKTTGKYLGACPK